MSKRWGLLMSLWVVAACGGVEGEEYEDPTAEVESELCTGCTLSSAYGTDEIGETCSTATWLPASGGSDEINAAGDIDAWRFNSDSAYHNYRVTANGVWGAANIDCNVKYANSYGTWTLIASDSLAGKAGCDVRWTSSTARTYCVEIYGYGGYASAQRIFTQAYGITSDGSSGGTAIGAR
jgi:hypothetical protein